VSGQRKPAAETEEEEVGLWKVAEEDVHGEEEAVGW
jgi:hypothetical protein